MSVGERSRLRTKSWDVQPCSGWPEVKEEARDSVWELEEKKPQKAKGRLSEKVGVVILTEWYWKVSKVKKKGITIGSGEVAAGPRRVEWGWSQTALLHRPTVVCSRPCYLASWSSSFFLKTVPTVTVKWTQCLNVLRTVLAIIITMVSGDPGKLKEMMQNSLPLDSSCFSNTSLPSSPFSTDTKLAAWGGSTFEIHGIGSTWFPQRPSGWESILEVFVSVLSWSHV